MGSDRENLWGEKKTPKEECKNEDKSCNCRLSKFELHIVMTLQVNLLS